MDAIVDVVGSLLALDLLGVDRIVCSPIPTGSGTISCQHGVLPVPAPATAELLKGIPLMACDEVGELTTPTGAAILTTVADEFGPLPPMSLAEIGYGAGTRDGGSRPNVLRVLIGHSVEAGETDEITVLETNLDDASPELVGYCMERLMSEGALDAYVVPIQMKKSRPGVLLTVLCEQQRVAALEQVLFAETTTFGIRRQRVVRVKMTRRHETVRTRFGTVRVKVGSRDGVQTVSPEYEDCRALAEQRGAPLREVVAAASAAWRALSDAPGGVGKQP